MRRDIGVEGGGINSGVLGFSDGDSFRWKSFRWGLGVREWECDLASRTSWELGEGVGDVSEASSMYAPDRTRLLGSVFHEMGSLKSSGREIPLTGVPGGIGESNDWIIRPPSPALLPFLVLDGASSPFSVRIAVRISFALGLSFGSSASRRFKNSYSWFGSSGLSRRSSTNPDHPLISALSISMSSNSSWMLSALLYGRRPKHMK